MDSSQEIYRNNTRVRQLLTRFFSSSSLQWHHAAVLNVDSALHVLHESTSVSENGLPVVSGVPAEEMRMMRGIRRLACPLLECVLIYADDRMPYETLVQ